MKTLKIGNITMHEIDNRVIVHNDNFDRKEVLPMVYKDATLCEVYDKYKKMGLLE